MNVPPPRSFADLVGFHDRQVTGVSADREVHGTTVLSLRYDGGILTLADRRATMGNLIMFDQAEKIMPLDDATVVAISGSFARSIEVCRMLKHSYKYYRRMHMSSMSTEGKLQEISRALAGNMPMAMQGIGVFIPILSMYDSHSDEFKMFFFDAAGAQFLSGEYAAAGSGSERIRGIFEYLTRTGKPWRERKLADVLKEGLRMLDIAADLDSATGGFGKTPPMAQLLDRDGTRPVDAALLTKTIETVLGR
ncbi:MAG: hypothetical protein JNM85_04440 [Chthonomonas sp.]|nr:hypothetical protein [Chthonomonas sp.]